MVVDDAPVPCFYCDADLREVWDIDGCARCGFYFDGDHLSELRKEDLDILRQEYERSCHN